MLGHFDTFDNAARDTSHPVMQAVDLVVAVGATSSVFWWQFLDSGGHWVLLAMGLVGGAMRLALMVREWRKGK